MEKVDSYHLSAADIIVGIPSYNEADNIANVVKQCNLGLRKYYPNLQSVIINVDNNSPDETRDAFLNAVNTIPKVYISTEPGVTGKGNNFYNLFQEAVRLKAKAVVVVDADLLSITPEWIQSLAEPILTHGHDFVTPIYSRNEYDGTITNNICYPIIYGLMGRNIRQPIGGDFAFSGQLAEYYLKQSWVDTTYQYGIDIFMTMNAILGGFSLSQTGLGAKIHKPSAPKLGAMFSQVIGTLFNMLLDHKADWSARHSVQDLPVYGSNVMHEPQCLSIDYKSIKAQALNDFVQNETVLREHLHRHHMKLISAMYREHKLEMHNALWQGAVYDLLYAYDKHHRDARIIEALKPLYFGRVATFIRETLDMDHGDCEEEIIRQARHFFAGRSYLTDKYEQSMRV
ncbi:MAG: glycosyltransferase [Caldithrix sp.]|nr:glycosyltransferase [Caldithrix sp.]